MWCLARRRECCHGNIKPCFSWALLERVSRSLTLLISLPDQRFQNAPIMPSLLFISTQKIQFSLSLKACWLLHEVTSAGMTTLECWVTSFLMILTNTVFVSWNSFYIYLSTHLLIIYLFIYLPPIQSSTYHEPILQHSTYLAIFHWFIYLPTIHPFI